MPRLAPVVREALNQRGEPGGKGTGPCAGEDGPTAQGGPAAGWVKG